MLVHCGTRAMLLGSRFGRDFEAEVWSRFWSWILINLRYYLQAVNFGKSTQPLGVLCLWQRFRTYFDIHKIPLFKYNVSSNMLSNLDLQGLAVKKINFQLWQAVPPAANMLNTLVQQSQKHDTDWSNCFGRDFYTRKGRWTLEQWNSKTTFFMQSLPNSLDQLAIFTRYRQQVLT